MLGIIAATLLVAGDVAVLFGLIGTSQASITAIPVALFEFSRGVYLVVKGLKPSSPILSSDPRDAGLNRPLSPGTATR